MMAGLSVSLSMSVSEIFDVIVIGGGHAGTEAAAAATRTGARTLLITQNLEAVGQMSCNPAIGGIGKGHLVKEIDALGGVMALATDRAGIQFRTLNSRKGPAVRATRAQADRRLYRRAVRARLEAEPGLTLLAGTVDDLMVEGARVMGVITHTGARLPARAVVLTTGTFLGGRIHMGLAHYAAGRAGDPPANALAARLRELMPRVGRLKTGTPPRLDGRTLDYSVMTEQPGDVPTPVFSFIGRREEHPRQVSCHITRTTTRTHDLIRNGLDRSPMYTGVIEGVGPRYCPSIEDKIVRFAERDSHQIFVEPEGLDTDEVYPNGISTSLPYDVQIEMVRSIRGFERAELTRPGYAIEYDYFDPRDLRPTLETKQLAGLFFAGQINGTTGYEEAGAQGLLAGLNAARRAQDAEPWWPRRHEAYLGVLVDDLITRGVTEPYRMFTSRAEHRLLLREDNADRRLTAIGRRLGLVDDERWRRFEIKQESLERERARAGRLALVPGKVDAGAAEKVLGSALTRATTLADLLRRPDARYPDLLKLAGETVGVGEDIVQQLEIDARYSGYIARQEQEIEQQRRHEETGLPDGLDYQNVFGLSHEVRQNLARHRPATLGEASRLSGITPAAISLLMVHLKRRRA